MNKSLWTVVACFKRKISRLFFLTLALVLHLSLSPVFASEQIGASGGGSADSSRSVNEWEDVAHGHTNFYKGDCHPFVRQLVHEDKEDLSALVVSIRSQYQTCRMNTTPEKVRERFGSSKGFSDFLARLRFQGLGKNNQFDQRGCDQLKLRNSHEVAAKFYYLSSRVDQAQQGAAAQVAALDRVLADQDSLNQLGCDKTSFTEVQ